ncbi:glucuronate isomerase [Saccharobesus litoralis]|uniref:Uronate isomerase n=1 Tax=Saccharobesus litoralis TaxID=2172099 RepID=A0A2S0VMF2_9ALTE|nr:glucuronate isomerase [Saccharobesus litoralis]AWB65397.1 glucuronate isomerase [Saccharobesus litoralis]
MKPFLADNFLLNSPVAEQLYSDYAAKQPIYDYHSHLNPAEIALDMRFDNIAQIWLQGDHYKWRAMRAAGVDENKITGTASDKEKYLAWAKTVPLCIGNPSYHWTHMELKRPFGIEGALFGPETAEQIWQQTSDMLSQPEFSARGILKQMNVKYIGTTDDPLSSLSHHQTMLDDANFDISITPSWRPDKAFKIELPDFADYMQQLGEKTDIEIHRFSDLLAALTQRIEHFEAHQCRTADHGIENMRFAEVPSEAILDSILQKRLAGETLSELETDQFFTAVNVWLAEQYCRLGWVLQMHIGPQRNNSSRVFAKFGADAGCDSMSDKPFSAPLGRLLDTMDINNTLPKTILYAINPAANEMLATMVGNFNDGSVAGKVQFGSAWWFNDQKDGMQRQLEQVAQLGLLSQFVGMLTDSRSLLSFTRHEYFRRILCNKLGDWVMDGEAPHDIELLGNMVNNICYNNSKQFFAKPHE